MRVLVTGASGQLARAVRATWTGHELLCPDEAQLDLSDRNAVRTVLGGLKPEVVLNLAAFTQVDLCESQPERALLVNGTAVGWLAESCCDLGALLVQISTDYVFDGCGTRPYLEDDPTAPRSVYGQTKLTGEELASTSTEHLIVRTAWLYDAWGKNFLLTMLRLARQRDSISVVGDQIGSPTTSIELARATHAIVSGEIAGRYGATQEWAGLYHMTCSGSTSRYGFAQAIFARAEKLLDGKIPQLTQIASQDYLTPAVRPRNSVLSNAKLEQRFGVRLAPWETALDVVLQALG